MVRIAGVMAILLAVVALMNLVYQVIRSKRCSRHTLTVAAYPRLAT